MGPQPFGCGRITRIVTKMRGTPLQWGRNLSVAEGRRGRRSPGRGRRSFNGAATFRLRKDPGLAGTGTLTLELQWGRNLSVAEGDNPPGRVPAPRRLQWGRNLSVAEGRAPSKKLSTR